MEFNAHRNTVSVLDSALGGSAEYAVDLDIALPEYLPDIVRVLNCSITPNIQSHQITGDRINAECDCTASFIYVCESNKVHCFSQSMHFSKHIELKPTESNENVFVGAKTDYVNYRVAGQRKLEIHGAVSIYSKITKQKNYEYIDSAVGDGITLKCEKAEVCNLALITEKLFTLNETCETINPSISVDSVISSSASAIIDDVKIIANKFFIKGELILHAVFLSSETCEIQHFDTAISLNQIIEVSDLTEDKQIDAHISVLGLDIRPKFDSMGSKCLLDVSATLGFTAYTYENSSVTLIKDAYSTKYETELKKSNVYTASLEEKIDDTFLCRGIIDLKSTGMTRVLSFMCTDITNGFSLREDTIAIFGDITTEIIYEDAKGDICFATRQIPYEYQRNSTAENAILTCKPVCTITAFNYILSEKDTLDVRIEININGFLFREQEMLVATEIVLNKEKIKSVKTATLTVYFADEGESLWDIAESFNTTVDAIIKENHIQDGNIKKKCKLLIPKV
jgi:hypothetical protein